MNLDRDMGSNNREDRDVLTFHTKIIERLHWIESSTDDQEMW